MAPSGKAEARQVAAAFLVEAGAQAPRPRLFVRVNGLETGLADADLDSVMAARPDGIMLPDRRRARRRISAPSWPWRRPRSA